ncbi:MAG: response regulator transcription factor [Vampirovibrionales bacterium]|nr:response regulator transcription factor [Vampirovibrionales bacterium]
MVHVLVVDDDAEILDLLRLDFELLGFEVDAASDGVAGLKKAEQKSFDMVVLDVMMPKLDGYEVCRQIRANRHFATPCEVPIILLTAKGTLEDKVRGFNAGADDYLVKPFEFQEMIVRTRALFRRAKGLQPPAAISAGKPKSSSGLKPKEDRLAAGDLRLLPTSLEVLVKDKLQKLTPTEFEILFCLMQHVNEGVPLATLLQEVWGYDADEDVRMLRVHVGGIRQKIEADPKQPRYLETVTNIGYRLNDHVAL